MSGKLSTKEKLDAALGIEEGQSIDELLEELASESSSISASFGAIDEKVHESLQKVDASLEAAKSGSQDSSLALRDMDASLREVEELIELSKRLFKHLYENIVSSDLIDSELIEAAAKMLESVHVNIGEFLQLYRDKQRFAEKIRVMVFQQEQKKELMLLKHKLDMEKLEKKAKDEAGSEDLVEYSVEDITRALKKAEEEELV